MTKFAVVSVYDKTGLEPLVKALSKKGLKLLSTGKTAKYLHDLGFEVQLISDYTAQAEILDGRVKTLHPKIYAGILARRQREDDLAELEKVGMGLVDFVVVNLYPFTQKVLEIEEAGNVQHETLEELIDIGGPTMLRAAAKNCHHVVPVVDPADYQRIIEELDVHDGISVTTRRYLASRVFATTAAYDGAIARYFSLEEQLLQKDGKRPSLAPIECHVLEERLGLRYGENPHQEASLYRRFQIGERKQPELWVQLQGKELSYNNLLDIQAALDLLGELCKEEKPPVQIPQQATGQGKGGKHVAVIIKHTNPCGVAIRDSLLEAFRAARQSDPLSAFGGVVAVSGRIDKALAQAILEEFVEVVLAQDVDEEAMPLFQKKKNVRLVKCNLHWFQVSKHLREAGMRTFGDEYLLQTGDRSLVAVKHGRVASQGEPLEKDSAEKSSELLWDDLQFAWAICKHVKSNAIVIVKDCQVLGIGAGQMSRVDAAQIAVQRALAHGHKLQGAVAASDAFLPFPDTLEILNDAGIAALVQPGGSVKDEQVIDSAKARGVLMVFTGERHFRH